MTHIQSRLGSMDLYSADKHICWVCSPLALDKSLSEEWGERRKKEIFVVPRWFF